MREKTVLYDPLLCLNPEPPLQWVTRPAPRMSTSRTHTEFAKTAQERTRLPLPTARLSSGTANLHSFAAGML